MRISFKKWRRPLLVILIVLGLVVTIVWIWVIPRAIVAAIRQRYDGDVTISGWWINGSTAGVTGLTLRETTDPNSPAWLITDRVATDLNVWGMLRGRFAPRRIVVRHPSIRYRLDAEGHPLTRIQLTHSGSGPIPELIAEDGQLAIDQAGRPEMLVVHLGAHMVPDFQGPKFEVRADDPAWGHPTLDGRFAPDFASSQFELKADDLVADRDKELRIPFVDPNVWQYFNARGPIGIVLECSQPPEGSGPPSVKTTVIFEKTKVFLPSLDLVGDETTGRAIIHDKIVNLADVQARLIGGRGTLSGRLDFTNEVVRYHLSLGLDGVNLDATPPAWDLDRRDVKGRITATAAMRMSLSPRGLDLTGSSASGRIDGAVIQGLPLGQLDLTLRGEGLRSSGSAASAKGPFLQQWLGVDFQVRDVELKRALAQLDPAATGHPRRAGLGPAEPPGSRPAPARCARRPEDLHGPCHGRLGRRVDRRPGSRPADGPARSRQGPAGAGRPPRPPDRPTRRSRPAPSDRPAPGRGPAAPGRFPRPGPGRARRRFEAPPGLRGRGAADPRAGHGRGLARPPALRPAHDRGVRRSQGPHVLRPAHLDALRPRPNPGDLLSESRHPRPRDAHRDRAWPARLRRPVGAAARRDAQGPARDRPGGALGL